MELKYFLLRLLNALVVMIGLLLIYKDHYLYGYSLLVFGVVLLFIFSHYEVKARKKLKKSV